MPILLDRRTEELARRLNHCCQPSQSCLGAVFKGLKGILAPNSLSLRVYLYRALIKRRKTGTARTMLTGWQTWIQPCLESSVSSLLISSYRFPAV